MTRSRRVRPRRVAAGAAGLALAVVLAGCAGSSEAETETEAVAGTPTDDPSAEPSAASSAGDAGPDPRLATMAEHAVDPPGPLGESLLGADMLVSTQGAIDEETLEEIRALPGVEAAEPIGLAQVPVEDQVLTVAAVDPASYRRFTPAESAQLETIWTRVAAGEVALQADVGELLRDEEGFVRLGNEDDAPDLHVGALAPQVTRVQAVVNKRWGETLGIPDDNAVLVATGLTSPQEVRAALQEAAGDGASVQVLGPDLDVSVQQTAVLTGGSVAAAVGTFNYRVLDGGRLAPDPSWVAENIRTAQVPILGSVTCHRVMLPQLEAALREVVERGLADKIDPEEYAGCYYPRFIAGSTQPSLHSFGIAVDLNVSGNQRGMVGDIDRSVVQIFKKWGFAWGGDWGYTDPMHFELAQLVEAR
ncbi:M15 family metallopeptidase [Nocardioides sp. CPCC 205120]|uniref:M15 family metallopeptidase n=1 Tax=Nocardioides sp. CPCC 205120 TaxID=3406462 RepID=UPI003B50DBEE